VIDRTRRARLIGAVVFPAVGLACGLLSRAVRPAAGAATTTTAASSRPTFSPAFPAMTYYDQSCANCHGPHGSFYGPTLGNDLTDAALVRKCRDMAKGPGNAPLEPDDNLVVAAYHRSLIRGTPFLSVTSVADGQWAGEATAGAKVTLRVNGGRPVVAAVDDWNWTAALPADTAPEAVVIDATLNGKTTQLRPADSAWSDTAPLPPPDRRTR
jgi:hypothetical protein